MNFLHFIGPTLELEQRYMVIATVGVRCNNENSNYFVTLHASLPCLDHEGNEAGGYTRSSSSDLYFLEAVNRTR